MGAVSPLALLQAHTSSVNCVAFNSDSSVISSGSSDCTVRTWDLSSIMSSSNTRKLVALDNGACIPGVTVLPPHGTFYTKKTPVYSVGYFDGKHSNLMYASGPFIPNC